MTISVSIDDGMTWTRVETVRIDPLLDRELTMTVSKEGYIIDEWENDDVSATACIFWDDAL